MRHFPLISAIVLGALTAPVGLAQDDPIAARQESMKSVGQSARTVGNMLRGRSAFDAAAANEAFAVMQTAAATYGTYFPEGSETGGETEAAPAIWSDRAGFDAELTAFQERIAAAVAAAPTTQDEVTAVFGPIGQSCRSCHESYRIEN